MLAQWTGQVIGDMHIHNISSKELACEMKWNAKYLSQVLNERVTPKGAETKVRTALDSLIAKKEGANAE